MQNEYSVCKLDPQKEIESNFVSSMDSFYRDIEKVAWLLWLSLHFSLNLTFLVRLLLPTLCGCHSAQSSSSAPPAAQHTTPHFLSVVLTPSNIFELTMFIGFVCHPSPPPRKLKSTKGRNICVFRSLVYCQQLKLYNTCHVVGTKITWDTNE